MSPVWSVLSILATWPVVANTNLFKQLTGINYHGSVTK